MTETAWHTGTPPDDWDELQTNLSAHFLQQRAWAVFQAALGQKIFYASGKSWSWMAVLEANHLGSRLYVPYGPTASSPESLRRALEVLRDCATAQDVDFIRIEPNAPNAKKILKQLRAQHAHRDIQPRHTLLKDLTRPDEELLGEMMSTNRRLHRRASEAGFTFSVSHDVKDLKPFLEMTHEVAKRTGIQPHADDYFVAMATALLPLHAATLFTAWHNGKPVAISLAFEDARTRYYAHAASAELARKLQPSVYLVGHMIFDAKAAGKQRFDYYGVAPPNAPKHHPWAGLTQFKRSFGGQYVEYSGTWELPIKKARYQAYRLLRSAHQMQSKSRKIVTRFARRTRRPPRKSGTR